MLTNFRVARWPAAYCTIKSVPPAIGSQVPGSLASSESTDSKLLGATSSYSAGCDLIAHLDGQHPRQLQKFACNRCIGKDCRIIPRECPRWWVAGFCSTSEPRQVSFREYRCRTARLQNQEKPVAARVNVCR